MEEAGGDSVSILTGAPVSPSPQQPDVLDYGAVPQPASVLVTLLACLALVGAALLARFLDRAVLRPAWTARDLPCENALYLLFSVAVTDLLQAACVLVHGLQLLLARWFLSRPLCRLWVLLDAVASSARLLFLLAMNARLARDGHWSRPLKVWLVSLLWLLAIAGSYLAVQPIGLRQDHTCGLRYVDHAPAAALWRYAVDAAAGLLLLPVAVGVYLWFRGRPPGGAAGVVADCPEEAQGSSEGTDKSDKSRSSAENVLKAGNETRAKVTSSADQPCNDPQVNHPVTSLETTSQAPVPPPASPLPYAQRIRKLERCDTYTPSTFTLKKFWGMPSVDELSTASSFSELLENAERVRQEEEVRRHHLTPHQVTEVRRKVHLLVLMLSVAHFGFSLAAVVVDVLIDLQMTGRDPWRAASLVLDTVGRMQPLATALLFSCMFPRFYKMLFKGNAPPSK